MEKRTRYILGVLVLSVGVSLSAGTKPEKAGLNVPVKVPEKVRVARGIFRLSESEYQLQLKEIKPSPVTQLNAVLQTARIVPSPKSALNPVELEGFIIKAIERNSFLEHLGFKKNDLIESVGETKLDNMLAGFQAVQKMRGAKRVDIGILRKNIHKKMVYWVD